MPCRQIKAEDIFRIVQLHRECFPTDARDDTESTIWVSCNYEAGPRMTYYVSHPVDDPNSISGYILWKETGGFREEAVLELEQIGVAENGRGQGTATRLIQESLRHYNEEHIENDGRRLKLVMVTTGAENFAQQLYKKALGAEAVATIPELYDGDEVLMMARRPQLEERLGI